MLRGFPVYFCDLNLEYYAHSVGSNGKLNATCTYHAATTAARSGGVVVKAVAVAVEPRSEAAKFSPLVAVVSKCLLKECHFSVSRCGSRC